MTNVHARMLAKALATNLQSALKVLKLGRNGLVDLPIDETTEGRITAGFVGIDLLHDDRCAAKSTGQ